MSTGRSFFQANQLLAQFVPHEVLAQARKLAERIECEERFKTYLLKRFWIIFGTALLFFAVNSACAVAAISLLDMQLTPHFEVPRNAGLLLVAVLWIGGFLIQLYLLFAWLERRAVKEGIFSDGCNPDPIGKIPPSFPWGLFALFVAIPLVALLLCAPEKSTVSRSPNIASGTAITQPHTPVLPNSVTPPASESNLFQITRMGDSDAELLFFGWDKNTRSNSKQRITVQRGKNADTRIAVVRRIISIIREHEREDFLWDSRRLGHNIKLSARPKDNAELEEFMMKEFFADTRQDKSS